MLMLTAFFIGTFSFQSIDSRFYPYEEIETDAVLGLDDDTIITTDEVNTVFVLLNIYALISIHPHFSSILQCNSDLQCQP